MDEWGNEIYMIIFLYVKIFMKYRKILIDDLGLI